MTDPLEQALKEALEAERAAPRRRRHSEDVVEHDLDGVGTGTVKLVRDDYPDTAGWRPSRRSVGEALRTLPGGQVWKPLWIVVREVVLFAVLFWLVLVGISMWQTAPPIDLLLDRRAALITGAVVALSIRLAWSVARHLIIDALTD